MVDVAVEARGVTDRHGRANAERRPSYARVKIGVKRGITDAERETSLLQSPRSSASGECCIDGWACPSNSQPPASTNEYPPSSVAAKTKAVGAPHAGIAAIICRSYQVPCTTPSRYQSVSPE